MSPRSRSLRRAAWWGNSHAPTGTVRGCVSLGKIATLRTCSNYGQTKTPTRSRLSTLISVLAGALVLACGQGQPNTPQQPSTSATAPTGVWPRDHRPAPPRSWLPPRNQPPRVASPSSAAAAASPQAAAVTPGRWTFDSDAVGSVPTGAQVFSGQWAVRAEPDAPSPPNALCQTGQADFQRRPGRSADDGPHDGDEVQAGLRSRGSGRRTDLPRPGQRQLLHRTCQCGGLVAHSRHGLECAHLPLDSSVRLRDDYIRYDALLVNVETTAPRMNNVHRQSSLPPTACRGGA